MNILGLSAQDAKTPNFNIGVVVAGSNIYLLNTLYESTAGKVAVLSRTGTLLGLATTPPGLAGHNGLTMVFSPSSPEWAWLIDQSPAAQQGSPTYRDHGVINMGGLGEPNRTVYHWLAPAGNIENLDSWTTAGIIIHREQYAGVDCNIFYQPGSAWFALNPQSGTLTQIADGNKVALLSASNTDIVATPFSDAHDVLINGVTYSESESQVSGAAISPDGAYVAVDRYSEAICDLNAASGTNSVEMVSVASKTHVDLHNLKVIAWLGTTELVVSPPDGSAWLYTLAGKPISDIGGYIGSLG